MSLTAIGLLAFAASVPLCAAVALYPVADNPYIVARLVRRVRRGVKHFAQRYAERRS